MKAKAILICSIICLQIFYAGCMNSNDKVQINYESELYTVNRNMFNQHYSISLFEYSNILDVLASSTQETFKQDISYVKGIIDYYNRIGNTYYRTFKEYNLKNPNKIINSKLNEHIEDLLSTVSINITFIKNNFVDKGDFETLRQYQDSFKQLSIKTKELNISTEHMMEEEDVELYLYKLKLWKEETEKLSGSEN